MYICGYVCMHVCKHTFFFLFFSIFLRRGGGDQRGHVPKAPETEWNPKSLAANTPTACLKNRKNSSKDYHPGIASAVIVEGACPASFPEVRQGCVYAPIHVLGRALFQRQFGATMGIARIIDIAFAHKYI